MMTPRCNWACAYVALGTATGLALVVDCLTPIGVATWIAYVLIVFLSSRAPWVWFPLLAAATCTILTALGFFLSAPSGFPVSLAIANRVLGISVLWITAYLGMERRIATDELRESEERHRRLLEVVPDAILINTDGRISYCNSAGARLFGAAAPSDLLGKTSLDLFHPTYHDVIRQRIQQMQERNGSVSVLEEEIVRLDGQVVPVEVVATAISYQGKQSFLIVLHDLSERKKTESKLQLLIEGVKDYAIFMLDLQGNVTSWNSGAERILGYRAEEVIGRPYSRFFPPEDVASRFPQYELDQTAAMGCLSGRAAKMMGGGREVEARRKDGSTFPIELAVTEFQAEVDGKRYFTGIIRDLSDRKKLEAQLRQSQKMEAFGQLAGGVAHDFNNLLTVIGGFSEILLSQFPETKSVREPLEQIQQAGERAATLTRQLLAFSRQQVLEPKVLNLNAVVTEMEKMLQRLIGEDIELTATLAPDLQPVKLDPGQMDQVIMNLAVNARDAMPRGGKLTIETQNVELDGEYVKRHPEVLPGQYVQLAVSDTGCGMGPEVSRRVFEPFFTTKGARKGTGLGLAVVHGIVKQSGGSIEVYSEVGTGTSFKIYFPASPEVEAGPRADDSGLVRGTETILLAEDEDAVRAFSVYALQAQGYTVLQAASGNDALRAAEDCQGLVDLLVTDVVMPQMSGRELAEIMRARYPNVKVLFLSGYTDDAVMRHGILQQDVAFLQKPFTPTSLARRVRAVLDTQSVAASVGDR